jgi:hypothetical protein
LHEGGVEKLKFHGPKSKVVIVENGNFIGDGELAGALEALHVTPPSTCPSLCPSTQTMDLRTLFARIFPWY